MDEDVSYVTDSILIAELFDEQFTLRPLASVSDTPQIHPNVTTTFSLIPLHVNVFYLLLFAYYCLLVFVFTVCFTWFF